MNLFESLKQFFLYVPMIEDNFFSIKIVVLFIINELLKDFLIRFY